MAKPPIIPANVATVRPISIGVVHGRPSKSSAGQARSAAARRSPALGFTAAGWPTVLRNGTSSPPLEYAKLASRSTSWLAANSLTAAALPSP